MTPKKINIILVASIVLLLIGFIGGAYLINSTLQKQADHLTKSKAKFMAQEEEKVVLKRAKSDIKKYAYLNNIAQTIVPEDKDQAQTVREIVNLAAKNGIDISSITFPASTLGKVGNGTAAAPSSQSAATLINPKASDKPTKTDMLSQLVPVKSVPGVYQLTINVQNNPNRAPKYPQLIQFLKDLETNRRTALISSINLSPKKNDPNSVSFELTLNEYIKP